MLNIYQYTLISYAMDISFLLKHSHTS